MIKMKIIIITEGSHEIGFGHITRCMSLYQAFEEKKLFVQFIVNGDSSIKHLLRGTNHLIFNWLDDPSHLFNLLNSSNIVFIDSYLADESFYKKISELVTFTVYIDDNKRITYPNGIVINGSIFASKLNYPPLEETEYLFGSQFIPLRKDFWNIPEKKINTDIKNIMITFGGDDLRNITPDLLQFLINECPNYNKKVVIGKGFKNISKIENFNNEKTEFLYYPDARGMLNLMIESDIAISAGGQTLYELARVGLPTIAIGVALNQKHNLDNWKKAGFIEFAGFWNNKNLHDNVLEKIELLKDKNIRLEMCKSGKGAVDGQGAIRIVNYCLNKYYIDKISIRNLESRDIYNVFDLSNDDEVRQNSFNTDKIKFEDHEKWFKKKIKDSNNIFLVANIDNIFAGQLRFDIEDYNAIISISIAKSYRKLGITSIILKKSIKYLKANSSTVKFVVAHIKEDNTGSVNFFEKAGFKLQGKVNINNHRVLEYVYKISD